MDKHVWLFGRGQPHSFATSKARVRWKGWRVPGAVVSKAVQMSAPRQLVLALVLALTAPLCVAAPELRVSTFAQWWGFDSLGELDSNEDFYSSGDDTESSFVNSSSSVSASTYSAGGPGHASMLVGYGYLQGESSMGNSGSTAFAGVLGDPSFGGGFEMGASGRFEDDTVVITAPGMSGQGTFTALFQMDLDLVNDTTLFSNAPNPLMPDTYAMAELRLRFSGVNLTYEAQWNRSYPGDGPLVETHTSSFPEGIVGVPVTFTYGQPFTIRGRASLDAGMDVAAGQLAQGRAIARLPGSFRWMGMDGLPTGATVQGAIDWSQPAPLSPLSDEGSADQSSGGVTSSGGGALGGLWLLGLLGIWAASKARWWFRGLGMGVWR